MDAFYVDFTSVSLFLCPLTRTGKRENGDEFTFCWYWDGIDAIKCIWNPYLCPCLIGGWLSKFFDVNMFPILLSKACVNLLLHRRLWQIDNNNNNHTNFSASVLSWINYIEVLIANGRTFRKLVVVPKISIFTPTIPSQPFNQIDHKHLQFF